MNTQPKFVFEPSIVKSIETTMKNDRIHEAGIPSKVELAIWVVKNPVFSHSFQQIDDHNFSTQDKAFNLTLTNQEPGPRLQ